MQRWIETPLAMSFTYDLNVVETGAGSGDASIVVPINNGTFTVGFNAGITKKNTRDTSITMKYTSEELCDAERDPKLPKPKKLPGGLGLADWIESISTELVRADETPTAASYKVEFEVTSLAGIKPEIGIKKSDRQKVGGSVSLNGDRKRAIVKSGVQAIIMRRPDLGLMA